MSYIDVLIPGVIGLLLVTSPRLFTKAEGEKFEKAKKTLKTIGFVLIGVAVLYSIVKMLEHSWKRRLTNRWSQPLAVVLKDDLWKDEVKAKLAFACSGSSLSR
jgi:hypothetical protein